MYRVHDFCDSPTLLNMCGQNDVCVYVLFLCLQAAKIADALARDVHYTVDEKQKSVLLTEDG